MPTLRLPGPICTVLNAWRIDTGTLCLATSPVPASHTKPPRKKAAATKKVAPQPANSGLTEADFLAAAALLSPKVEPALVHAFARTESGGKSGIGDNGLPVIAYEGHWFRRFTKHQYDKTYPLLSYPYVKKAGPEWQANNKDQETAWKTLNQAAGLDHSAALQSTSWGMFQVMGFNYASCGYANVDAFVTDMKAGESGQLKAFVSYCKKRPGMITAMETGDYATMAFLYNGKDYGDYDQRIKKFYAKYAV